MKRDIHERDAEHLELAKARFEELCELYPDEFIAVHCTDGDELRPIEDIQKDIQKLI